MNNDPRDVTVDDLVGLFERDDDAGVVAASTALVDSVRDRAWNALRNRFAKASRRTHEDDALSPTARLQRKRTRALLALSIGPSDVSRIVGTWIVQEPNADSILATRSTTWRAEFVAKALHGWTTAPEPALFGPMWWDRWQWTRQQQHSSLLPVDPTSTDYLVTMVRGLLFSNSIVDAVRDDRSLADGPLWSLFEPRPAVQKALLGSDRFWNPANTWRVAFVRLAIDGLLDRARLERAATDAAANPQMGARHRAWYRKVGELLRHPHLIPSVPEHGPPPPGNQLYPRSR